MVRIGGKSTTDLQIVFPFFPQVGYPLLSPSPFTIQTYLNVHDKRPPYNYGMFYLLT